MTPAEITALRLELGRCRQQTDHALGTALQILDRIERDVRARAGVPSHEASAAYDLDHPLRTDDCEWCGFAWQACVCRQPGGGT